MMNVPNMLTISRIIMIPLMVACFYWLEKDGRVWVSILFASAAVTDWFDGYLARKLDQASSFGAFLDPVADKLIVAVALMLLVEEFSTLWLTLPSIVIVGREIVISALREWMAELGKRASVVVSYVGKVKTAFQMGAIIILLASNGHDGAVMLGYIALYVAALLTLWSMFIYLRAAWSELRSEN